MKLSQTSRAFALIVTVILLSLLAVMAVAFLSSSRIERGTSRGVADKVKSDLAAQSAVNAAISRLIDNLTNYPDSATAWEAINNTNPGTILYFRDRTPEAAIAAGTTAQMNVLPLISGGIVKDVGNKTSSLPVLNNSNSYSFNHARFSGDTQGWIGAPPGSASPPEYRGQWIDVLDSSAPPKVTARYAYWMEDESFKVNANLMGKTSRGSNTLGDNPSQIPFQGLFKTILTSGNPDTIADETFTLRSGFPNSKFFEYRALNQVNNQSTLADSCKFEASIFSGASDLSRSGSKRVNLNRIVAASTDPAAIRKQLDQIIKAVMYHLPNFAQRFYRNGSDKNSLDVPDTGSPSNQTIYLSKIAANIRDYIDIDSQPTIVNHDLTVNIGAVPVNSLPGGGASGTNEVIAIGKEAVPFIQEYLLRVKQLEFSNRLGASATYKLEIDHYVEFWNMTNKDISVANLGPNPFFRIANQFSWDANGAAGGTDIPEDPSRDFSIPLNSFTNSSGTALSFPAGMVTVLTTDPTSLPGTFPGVDPSRVFRPPTGTPADSYRIYQGTTKKKSGSNLRINSVPRPVNSSNAADLETEIILGNDNGILESFAAPAAYYITANVDDGNSNADSVHSDITQYYFRASSLKGNSASAIASQVGDPRTNGEQLSVTTSTADDDQTAYKLEAWNSPSQISNTSFTKLNSSYVNPALWVDVANNVTDAAHAPALVADSALSSIGQLGNVVDPVRAIGAAPVGSGNIIYSRGGGRTMSVGQQDPLWDDNSNSRSREWTSWRLTDVFTTTDSLQLDGRININGLNRDSGAAFKTALHGYNFQLSPNCDPTIASQALTDSQINSLVSQLQARLNNQAPFAQTVGPFAERGELSEMPVFNSGLLLTGHDMSSIYDRGREEVFRRLIELITTRGNIFTVYVVGQSLIPQASGNPIVTSTSQQKVTFRIDPVWNAGIPTDPNWDPSDVSSVNTRLSKPDKYAIKVLYVGE